MPATSPDYDAPRRRRDGDVAEEPLAVIGLNDTVVMPDLDDEDPESFDLPDVELSGDDLSVRVIPLRPNEFTCSRCFLVNHVTRLARACNGETICAECA